MNKIRKGDTVKILTGKDVGKTGVVHSVSPKKETLIVSGVNMVKKAQRRTGMSVTTQAGIIQREAPIRISNVALVCKNCGKATRVGFQQVGEDAAVPDSTIPRLSHETLAEMVGTTRSRITHFMNKFRREGLIDYSRHANGRGFGMIVRTRRLTDVLLQD